MPGWIGLGDEPKLHLSNALKRIGERRRETWIEKKAGAGVFSRLIIGLHATGGYPSGVDRTAYDFGWSAMMRSIFS